MASLFNEITPLTSNGKEHEASGIFTWFSWKVIGPGLLVCLADTDAGCLLVACQSGAKWGYSLLLLQVALVPVLFMAQELTIRLAIHTGKGHSACIREHFGTSWATFSCALLVVCCVGAIISDMSGVASVAEMWGLHRGSGTALAALVLVCPVMLLNYKQVEVMAIVFGLFELSFVISMFILHPAPADVFRGAVKFESDPDYLMLVASNVGAVIMPWMIYFQQSAVVAGRLCTREELSNQRTQTFIGSCLTQLVMIGALVSLAAAHNIRKDLTSVEDIQMALAPALGALPAKLILSIAFIGGSLCGAFVVALAASFGVCEAAGWYDGFALDRSPSEAPKFYGCFIGVVLVGAVVLMSGVDVVQLNIYVELINALLLPIAIGFLYLLATSDMLPPEIRVMGQYKVVVASVFTLCIGVATVTGVCGLVGYPS